MRECLMIRFLYSCCLPGSSSNSSSSCHDCFFVFFLQPHLSFVQLFLYLFSLNCHLFFYFLFSLLTHYLFFFGSSFCFWSSVQNSDSFLVFLIFHQGGFYTSFLKIFITVLPQFNWGKFIGSLEACPSCPPSSLIFTVWEKLKKIVMNLYIKSCCILDFACI